MKKQIKVRAKKMEEFKAADAALREFGRASEIAWNNFATSFFLNEEFVDAEPEIASRFNTVVAKLGDMIDEAIANAIEQNIEAFWRVTE